VPVNSLPMLRMNESGKPNVAPIVRVGVSVPIPILCARAKLYVYCAIRLRHYEVIIVN